MQEQRPEEEVVPELRVLEQNITAPYSANDGLS